MIDRENDKVIKSPLFKLGNILAGLLLIVALIGFLVSFFGGDITWAVVGVASVAVVFLIGSILANFERIYAAEELEVLLYRIEKSTTAEEKEKLIIKFNRKCRYYSGFSATAEKYERNRHDEFLRIVKKNRESEYKKMNSLIKFIFFDQ